MPTINKLPDGWSVSADGDPVPPDATTRSLSHDPGRETIERGFWERIYAAVLTRCLEAAHMELIEIPTALASSRPAVDPPAPLMAIEEVMAYGIGLARTVTDAALAEHRKQPWRVGQ